MDTALPTVGRLIWRWMEFHGLDAATLFAEQQIREADMRSGGDRIDVERFDRVLATALGQIGDECSGLLAARCWHPSDLGALGYAWLASSSIRTAVQRLERYSKIVGERASIVGVDTPAGLKVVLDQEPRDPRVHELVVDFVMSLMLDMARFNAGASLMPVEVTLTREQPDCMARYVAFYGTDVRFASAEDALTLAADDVDQALPTANRQLAGLHDRVLAQQLASLDRDNVVARSKAAILDGLTSGDVSAAQVARQLHMSPRTLARRLDAEGVSVKMLVEQTRKELASRYLADPKNSVTEVAFLLGFSHPSSLSRASSRWFGMSPIEYRSAQARESA